MTMYDSLTPEKYPTNHRLTSGSFLTGSSIIVLMNSIIFYVDILVYKVCIMDQLKELINNFGDINQFYKSFTLPVWEACKCICHINIA